MRGGVEEPAQHQDRVAPRVQRSPTRPGAALVLVIGQQLGQAGGRVFPDREYAGVGDRIGHAGPRYGVDLWSDRLLYRGPRLDSIISASSACRRQDHPTTGNTSIS